MWFLSFLGFISEIPTETPTKSCMVYKVRSYEAYDLQFLEPRPSLKIVPKSDAVSNSHDSVWSRLSKIAWLFYNGFFFIPCLMNCNKKLLTTLSYLFMPYFSLSIFCFDYSINFPQFYIDCYQCYQYEICDNIKLYSWLHL